jgi:hypothetical protein
MLAGIVSLGKGCIIEWDIINEVVRGCRDESRRKVIRSSTRKTIRNLIIKLI